MPTENQLEDSSKGLVTNKALKEDLSLVGQAKEDQIKSDVLPDRSENGTVDRDGIVKGYNFLGTVRQGHADPVKQYSLEQANNGTIGPQGVDAVSEAEKKDSSSNLPEIHLHKRDGNVDIFTHESNKGRRTIIFNTRSENDSPEQQRQSSKQLQELILEQLGLK